MIVYSGSRLKATDTNGNTQAVGVIGAEQDTLKVGDQETSFLLYKIWKELKIMNLHLSNMTDVDIETADIEV